MNKENVVYVVTCISSGECPLVLDEQRVFSTLDKAVDWLHHHYKEMIKEVEPYGEVGTYYNDNMYEITLTEDYGTTLFQGYVQTKIIE